MKKKKVIITSVLIVLLAAVFTFLRANLVTTSVICKEEKKFSPPNPKCLLLKVDINRKQIKSGNLSFECENLDSTRELVQTAVKEVNGFISEERLSAYERRSSQWLEIRVPAEKFDTLVEAISKGASRLEKRNIRIEDVTDQYLDTEIRLAVKKS
jgi:hypothetical protein